MAGGSLIATAVLLVGLVAPATSVASVASVQASVDALRQQVSNQAAVIHQFTTTYQQATLEAATLNQQIGADEASLTTLRLRVGTTRSALRQAALRSYLDGEATPSLSSSDDLSVKNEYLAIASGDVGDTVDRLGLEQRQLRSAEQTLAGAQRANASALAAATNARNDALATAGQEQAQLVTLQAHLEQLVTAQAVASAQSAAVRSAAASASRAKATQGAPVNNGLVSAVKSLVSPPAPTTSTTTGPTTEAPTTSGAPSPPATATPVSGNVRTSTTVTSPATAPSTVGSTAPTGGSTSADLAELRQCESGGNYEENTGNGFYGAYQFSASTWSNMGFPGRPDQEPPAMQDQAAEQLQASSGWGQWPTCASALGLT